MLYLISRYLSPDALTHVQGIQISVDSASSQGWLRGHKEGPSTRSTQGPVIISQPEDDDAADMFNGLSIGSLPATSNVLTTPFQARMYSNTTTPLMRPPNNHGSPIGVGLRSTGASGAWPVGFAQTSPRASAPSSGGRSALPWPIVGYGAVGQERVSSQYHQQAWSPVAQPNFDLARMGHRRESEQATSHHNVVDIERIQNGVDVRTTVSRQRWSFRAF